MIIIPLRFRKAGRVWLVAHERHEATFLIMVTAIKMELFLKSPCFFRSQWLNDK